MNSVSSGTLVAVTSITWTIGGGGGGGAAFLQEVVVIAAAAASNASKVGVTRKRHRTLSGGGNGTVDSEQVRFIGSCLRIDSSLRHGIGRVRSALILIGLGRRVYQSLERTGVHGGLSRFNPGSLLACHCELRARSTPGETKLQTRLHGFDSGQEVAGNRPLEHERIRACLQGGDTGARLVVEAEQDQFRSTARRRPHPPKPSAAAPARGPPPPRRRLGAGHVAAACGQARLHEATITTQRRTWSRAGRECSRVSP